MTWTIVYDSVENSTSNHGRGRHVERSEAKESPKKTYDHNDVIKS